MQYAATLARISSAVLVQMKGRGFWFHKATQSRMSRSRARVARWAERRSFLVVRSANQRSTRFSQEALVGVKWSTKRGWAASQRRIAGVLWVA